MGRSENAEFAQPRADPAPRLGSMEGGPALYIEPSRFPRCFDREPFAFTHNLHGLDLFRFDSLLDLAARYAASPRDYFVAAAAPLASSEFTSVEHGQCGVEEAMRRVDCAAVRVLLKRPENHDAHFRELLHRLFAQVTALRGGWGAQKVVRLESAVFITSASSITPFHFDPETAFFAQIEGRKDYHVYSPRSLSEAELERFYRQGIVSIAEVDLVTRDPGYEHVFPLMPGDGHHQPQNSPHWVATCAERSISYSFVFETNVSRARGRTRACNYFLRQAGIAPAEPGVNPTRDAAKAAAIRAMFPLRRRLSNLGARFRRG